mgnify:FL=1
MTLADRLNKIIAEQNISKQDFAARVGISRNYLYILTGNSGKNKKISRALAKLIAIEFGYDEEWIIKG